MWMETTLSAEQTNSQMTTALKGSSQSLKIPLPSFFKGLEKKKGNSQFTISRERYPVFMQRISAEVLSGHQKRAELWAWIS